MAVIRTISPVPAPARAARSWLHRGFSWAGRLIPPGGRANGAGTEATIRCLRPSARRPRADSENPTRSVMPAEEIRVFAHDMRRASPAPSLEREGFTLVAHQSRVSDFYDFGQVESVYLAEAEELVKAHTGARFAWALPRPVLRSEGHSAPAGGGAVTDRTAPVAHVDYPGDSAGLLVEAAERRRGRPVPGWSRLVLYTVWRSLRPPPQDRPLALCDLRTVREEDLVRADAVGNPGALAYASEFLLLVASPRHRWCYFPEMHPGEALLFQQLDSAAAGPSGCPHTSFADPAAGAAAPRLSIEARVCAFFD